MVRTPIQAQRTLLLILLASFVFGGCANPAKNLRQADEAAHGVIAEKQEQLWGKSEPFSIVPPSVTLRQRLFEGQKLPFSTPASLNSRELDSLSSWAAIQYEDTDQGEDNPVAPWSNAGPLTINLVQALQIGARNNREYQSRKENIFRAALDLDLERDEFRSTFRGLLESFINTDLSGESTVSGVENSATASWAKKLETGVEITTRLGIDLVNLLTFDRASSLGIFADATISIPLLRGAGKSIVAEPLTQAERNVIYEIYRFERFKRTFAVRIESEYLDVLQQQNEIANTGENYKNLLGSSIRARRLAEAGRLPEVQVDQAIQDALRARDRWITTQNRYTQRLDTFKITLGLPTDADIILSREEIDRLSKEVIRVNQQNVSLTANMSDEAGDDIIVKELMALSPAPSYSISEEKAIRLALDNRLDLRIAQGEIYDRQRAVDVAADSLRAELTLLASGSAGENRSISSADQPTGKLRPERGTYSALLALDLPFERTAEQIDLRNSLINFEETVRDLQELEDRIKYDIRNQLRNLDEFRQRIGIQAKSVAVAQRRVDSTNLFMQAGRVQIRDLLEAQEALVQARNSLIAAQVNYRVAELGLQRDMDVLQVSSDGIYHEINPENSSPIKRSQP